MTGRVLTWAANQALRGEPLPSRWAHTRAVAAKANRLAVRQYALYEDLRGQARLMLVDFCDLDPSCEVGDVQRWRNERAVAALRFAAIPAVLLFLGGWSVAVWWRSRESQQ